MGKRRFGRGLSEFSTRCCIFPRGLAGAACSAQSTERRSRKLENGKSADKRRRLETSARGLHSAPRAARRPTERVGADNRLASVGIAKHSCRGLPVVGTTR